MLPVPARLPQLLQIFPSQTQLAVQEGKSCSRAKPRDCITSYFISLDHFMVWLIKAPSATGRCWMHPEAKRDHFSGGLHRSFLYRIFISYGRETERNQAPKPLRLLFPEKSLCCSDPALLQHLPHVAPDTFTAHDSLPARTKRLLLRGEHFALNPHLAGHQLSHGVHSHGPLSCLHPMCQSKIPCFPLS